MVVPITAVVTTVVLGRIFLNGYQILESHLDSRFKELRMATSAWKTPTTLTILVPLWWKPLR